MKRFATLALALAIAAPAVQAQVSGSINRDAPRVTNTLEYPNGAKMTVAFTAIHFGEGMWMKAKDDAGARERLNSFAPRRPIGEVHTSIAVTAAGKTIPAGKYSLFFTVHESGVWILNLKDQANEDAQAIRWGLKLAETSANRKRMHIGLAPGDKSGTAAITIAFGNMSVTVPLAAAKGDAGSDK